MASERSRLAGDLRGTDWRAIRAGVVGLVMLCLFACSRSPAPPVKPAGGATASASKQAGTSTPAPPQATNPATSPERPAELVALNNRGVGLMGSFEFDQAQQVFAELVSASPDWNEARINEAIATLNQSVEGKQEEALAKLAVVLKDDPMNLRARYASGLCELFLGRPEEAVGHFAFVAKTDPLDPYAAYYHGQCLDLAGDSKGALAEYRRAAEVDPYLRSAFLGIHRSLQRLGRDAEAAPYLETFQKLADNPRGRLAEFKYTRMGRKAMAMAGDRPSVVAAVDPAAAERASFEDAPRQLATVAPGGFSAVGSPASVTVCDVDGDGRLDVYVLPGISGLVGLVRSALFVQGADGTMTLDRDHPLSRLGVATAALWGDVDNDGLVDMLLCSRNGAGLFMQSRKAGAAATWTDISATAGLPSTPFSDGVLADLDHDGDLDVLLVGGGHGGSEASLLINLDGRHFRDITAEAIPATVQAARQAVVGDLDGDRDLDIYIRCAHPPHALLRNDRLWQWRPWEGADAVTTAEMALCAIGDVNGDGTMDLVWLADRATGALRVAACSTAQPGQPIGVITSAEWNIAPDSKALVLADVSGDGTLRPHGDELVAELGAVAGWTLANLDVRRGPSIIAETSDGRLVERVPSTTRFDSAGIVLRGRTDPGQSMRSNASGIGALVNARVGDRWITRSNLSMSSTPGQSLQPMTIGLGGAKQVDFVDIDWSDGVFQSELAIPVGGPTTIVETQRQISSCPLIFAWNGACFGFVSDFLGVGGLGYLVKPGEYAPPRPWENFLLPEGSLHPRCEEDGQHFVLKLNEPMEEAVYLDRVGLVAYDVPSGWSMTLDERMGLAGPEPTGETRWFRASARSVRAFAAHGESAPIDVTKAVRAADGDAVPVGELDTRFIGRLRDELVVTIEFAEPIDGSARTAPCTPTLVACGWIEYPYCQTNFAAAQTGASYDAPTIEAQASDGTWSVVLANFGYPAGMPREMSVPLPALPRGCTALRIRTNQEIHWDSMAVAFVEPPPGDSAARQVGLVSALLESNGFPRRSEGPHRRPIYHDDQRTPLADMRAQPGHYTRLGQVDPLVAQQDGASAIFGPGEEIVLRFDATLPVLPAGWTRRYVLETRGWCKDMDLFTRDGETLGPIPGEREAAAEALHRTFNVRFAGGR